ncbi:MULTISPECIES: pyridoxamine 5'-phosphate oxidase family protein [Haloarcula]|uniref:pyridoxamine 5'-phosphate oxidase family protein n=1 Tax=Haloarcula TaxID=2237 RepID=UPI0023EDED5F|nr:pyridoxamine 5'-phosphate oxidase family protein [Halomicroarcula sp. XH51]
MNQQIAGVLDEPAIEAFLENRSTGTLALADEDESYAIPVAFTFAPETEDFYFRLGYGVGSRKRKYIETTERATFVVAAETESGWKSVVASGELEHRNTTENLDRVTPADSERSDAEHEQKIPFYHVFEAPSELLFTLVRLRTDELTGVVESTDD